MEEYINLYHQKLWEIAFANVEKVFGIFFIIWLVLSIYPVYISFHNLVRRKKLVLLLVCMPFLLFFLIIQISVLSRCYIFRTFKSSGKIGNICIPSLLCNLRNGLIRIYQTVFCII